MKWEGTTVRSFKRMIRGLRFKRRSRTALQANACHPSHIKACPCDDFANKLERRSPEKDWRLISRIHIGTDVRIDHAHQIELDEELLERIDFFACLFGSRRIE